MLEWLFRNRETGEITIAQFPNVPLWLFLGATVARWPIPDSSPLHPALGVVAVAGLGWWSTDELVRGVNPWRRILGAAGLMLTARGLIALVS